ncbi:L,D-transpeptidase family protein [Solirubrum puertoriconensis]|uniref:L,D-TPase catalytic domain-containing protein n=1 Tax=Solirubrum puertoriconensis TaxID=1751427 RepID=A0A9X0HKT0_SOLP1|nr:L,D-transpeptidase family protein [Solirubrum puertoriconensis]KUG07752.1 hypothetical protein ASU33_15670 [Solirubrum puertoriconensis]
MSHLLPVSWLRFVGLGLLLCWATYTQAQTNEGTTALIKQTLSNESASALPATLNAQVLRYYAALNFEPSWTTDKSATALAKEGLKILRRTPEFGFQSIDYKVQELAVNLDSFAISPDSEVRLHRRVAVELQLTAALLELGAHLRRGRVHPQTLLPTTCEPDSVFDPVQWLLGARQLNQLNQQVAALQPTTRSYIRLQWAWQKLLRADTAAARKVAGQVAVNLERLRWEPRGDSAYLLVNIPAYTLEIVRGAKVVRSFRVIVGDAQTPTPEVYSHLRFFQTSPEWKVPRSIALNEILPRVRRNPGYLASHNYVLYNQHGERVNPFKVDWKQITPETFRYSVRQTACCDNALGNVVFRFPNPHDIFVHDTPVRKLFNVPRRALSHGCIRLEKPFQLAAFLLRRDYGDKAPRQIERMWDSVYGGYSKYFALRNPIPIYIRYQTCHADSGPELRVVPDIYKRDALILQALQQASQEYPAAADK